MKKLIWIREKGYTRKYYLYGIFTEKRKALKLAKHYKQTHKSRNMIIKHETGILFPTPMYALYFDNIQTL